MVSDLPLVAAASIQSIANGFHKQISLNVFRQRKARSHKQKIDKWATVKNSSLRNGKWRNNMDMIA